MCIRDRFPVVSLLNDMALIHDEDGIGVLDGGKPVSYTHLDVYKRQS